MKIIKKAYLVGSFYSIFCVFNVYPRKKLHGIIHLYDQLKVEESLVQPINDAVMYRNLKIYFKEYDGNH